MAQFDVNSTSVLSQNVLNIGYILYLSLKDMKQLLALGRGTGSRVEECLLFFTICLCAF